MYGVSNERLASLARGAKPRSAYEACAAFARFYDQRETWNISYPVWQGIRSERRVLHSYQTPIAFHDGDFYVSMETHSPKTAQHISKLSGALASEGYRADYGTIRGLPRDLAYGWAHTGAPFVRYALAERTQATLWQSNNRKWSIVAATGDYAATIRDHKYAVGVVSPYGVAVAVHGDIPQYVQDAARDIVRPVQPIETYPDVALYKVVDALNCAHNGGTFDYAPGEWTPLQHAHVCVSGYHVTTHPERWGRSGSDRIYRVRVAGAPDTLDDKRAYPSIMLIPGYVTLDAWYQYVAIDPATLWESYAQYD